MAAPTPSATSPTSSPSSFKAASTMIIVAIFPSFSSIIVFTPSPGLPTFPPGPSALITYAVRPSIGTVATTQSFAMFLFGYPCVSFAATSAPAPSPIG